MLFDPARHEPLTTQAWSPEAVQLGVLSLYEDLCAGLQPELWPSRPEKDSEIAFNKSLYVGATGMLWTLLELSRRLERPLSFDPAERIEQIERDYLVLPDTGKVVPSYYLGLSTILLLKHKILPTVETADRLFELIEGNISNPVNEALWGCPGTALAALRMFEWTADERWRQHYLRCAEYLFEQWEVNAQGHWLWRQDLYGQKEYFLGAAHGFIGNVYALLSGQKHLSPEKRELLLQRSLQTVQKTVVRDEHGHANWPVKVTQDKPNKFLVQWCHGSPGFVVSLRDYPKSQAMDELLIAAGELTWAAGPLNKGIGICHGTDGNGYAFLQLFERTGYPQWRERARAFAMTALARRNQRFTLWTGDAGLAMYLLDCLQENAAWPTLDYF